MLIDDLFLHVNIWLPALVEWTRWMLKSAFRLLPCIKKGLIFPVMRVSCLRKNKTNFLICFLNPKPFSLLFFSSLCDSTHNGSRWESSCLLLPPTQTTYQFVSKRVTHSNYISPCQRTLGRGHQLAHPNAHCGRGTIDWLSRYSMRHNCFVSPSCKIPSLD